MCYGIWTKSIQLREKAINVERAAEFENRSILRRSIAMAKKKVTNCEKFDSKLEFARRIYRKRLLRKGFSAFMNSAASRKQTEQLNYVADQFYSQTIIEKSFQLWKQNYLTIKNDSKAQSYDDRRLLKTVFSCWRLMVIKSKRNNEKATLLLNAKNKSYLSQVLQKWHKIATEMGFEKQLAISREKSATHFNRRWILFHAEVRFLNQIQNRNNCLERRESLYFGAMEKLKIVQLKASKPILQQWRLKAQRHLKIQELEFQANIFHKSRIIFQTETRFCEMINRKRKLTKLNGRAEKFQSIISIKVTLSKMRKIAEQKIVEQKNNALAVNFLFESISWKYFRLWKDFHKERVSS